MYGPRDSVPSRLHSGLSSGRSRKNEEKGSHVDFRGFYEKFRARQNTRVEHWDGKNQFLNVSQRKSTSHHILPTKITNHHAMIIQGTKRIRERLLRIFAGFRMSWPKEEADETWRLGVPSSQQGERLVGANSGDAGERQAWRVARNGRIAGKTKF